MKEADFLLHEGKSKYALKQEVSSGRYPPCVCYKVIHSSPEEKRVMTAFLKVDLVGADVPLTFSCTFKAAESEWPGLCLSVHVGCFIFICAL